MFVISVVKFPSYSCLE